MEQQLSTGLGERQVAQLVEDDEVEATEVVRHSALSAGAGLGLELVDQVDDVEVATTHTAPDAGPGDGDGEVGLARAGAADQHDVALLGNEAAAGEVPDQVLVDRRPIEDELVDVLGEWQLGHAHLVADGTSLLLGDLGGN